MKRTRWLLLAALVVAVLSAILAPATVASAATPTAVSGEWSWTGGEFIPTDPVGDDVYFSGYEFGRWTGSFKGSSYEPYAGVAYADGSLWAIITISFTGTVDGARGKMAMQLTVDANADGTMGGQWAIIRGVGGLRHVRGVGTWVFTHGDDVYGYADYQGVVWKTSSLKSTAVPNSTAVPSGRARAARRW